MTFSGFPYPQPIQPRGAAPQVIFTRPADTTNYAAGDVIGSATSAIHEFINSGNPGGMYQVLGASVLINTTAVPTGMTTLTLHLLNAAPAAILDNAAFALAAADRNRYLAQVALPAVVAVGGGFVRTSVDIANDRPIVLAGSSVFGMLVTDAAVTTVTSAAEHQIRLFLAELA